MSRALRPLCGPNACNEHHRSTTTTTTTWPRSFQHEGEREEEGQIRSQASDASPHKTPLRKTISSSTSHLHHQFVSSTDATSTQQHQQSWTATSQHSLNRTVMGHRVRFTRQRRVLATRGRLRSLRTRPARMARHVVVLACGARRCVRLLVLSRLLLFQLLLLLQAEEATNARRSCQRRQGQRRRDSRRRRCPHGASVAAAVGQASCSVHDDHEQAPAAHALAHAEAQVPVLGSMKPELP